MASSSLEIVSKVKCFNGFQYVYRHLSKELNCSMKFSLFMPTTSSNPDEKFHTLFYLSGLTCSEENFIQKSGFQKYASEHKFIVLGPDTSPRGLNLPGDKEHWEFGESAGWYLDATEGPWKQNYRMYSYVTKELPELVRNHFPTTGTFGIFGHSMGGHGAIVCGLRNPDIFKSISAFAPASNPSQSPWGVEKAFKNFLGEQNREKWNVYDSCELVKSYDGPVRNILVDQGSADDFLESNLKPNNLKAAADQNSSKIELELRLQDGYNHSYFFVSTFIGDHFKHHSKLLNA